MTAKEFLLTDPKIEEAVDNGYDIRLEEHEWLEKMREFARYHVQKALEAAADNSVKLSSTKQTVIASYPLENIK